MLDAYALHDARDRKLREFWFDSLLTQLHAVPPSERRHSVWRMSEATRRVVEWVASPADVVAFVPMTRERELTVFGRPVEIDDSAEGAVLYVTDRPAEQIDR